MELGCFVFCAIFSHSAIGTTDIVAWDFNPWGKRKRKPPQSPGPLAETAIPPMCNMIVFIKSINGSDKYHNKVYVDFLGRMFFFE